VGGFFLYRRRLTMRPDTQHDTWSPWYEAFTPHAQAAGATAARAVTADAPVEASPPLEAGETDWANQALFDCYNG
jgi:hypothetical protein